MTKRLRKKRVGPALRPVTTVTIHERDVPARLDRMVQILRRNPNIHYEIVSDDSDPVSLISTRWLNAVRILEREMIARGR
jgi:hypothetical protein